MPSFLTLLNKSRIISIVFAFYCAFFAFDYWDIVIVAIFEDYRFYKTCHCFLVFFSTTYLINIIILKLNKKSIFRYKGTFHKDWQWIIKKSLRHKRKFKTKYLIARIALISSFCISITLSAYFLYAEAFLCRFDNNEVGVLVANFKGEDIGDMLFDNIEDVIESETAQTFTDSLLGFVTSVKRTPRHFSTKKRAIDWAAKYNAKYIVWGYKGKKTYLGEKRLYLCYNSPIERTAWKFTGYDAEYSQDFDFEGTLSIGNAARIDIPKSLLRSLVYEMIGYLAFSAGKYELVIQLFHDYPFRFPDMLRNERVISIINALAYAHYYTNNERMAKLGFQKLLELVDRYKHTNTNLLESVASKNLGMIYKKDGKTDSSKIYFERSISRYENNYSAILNLALLLVSENQFDSVINLSKRIPEGQEEHSSAIKLLVHSFDMIGEIDSTKVYLSKMLSITEDIPEKNTTFYGLLCLEHGLNEQAKSLLTKSYQANPDSIRIACLFGEALNALGQYDSTIFYLDRNDQILQRILKGYGPIEYEYFNYFTVLGEAYVYCDSIPKARQILTKLNQRGVKIEYPPENITGFPLAQRSSENIRQIAQRSIDRLYQRSSNALNSLNGLLAR
jgi:tetratricopeptide (TPR) repeat protein